MKLVVAFFLFLCFYLAGGYEAAHADVPRYGVIHSHFQILEKAPQESATASRGYLTTKDDGLGIEKDFLISVEDDDDEEDNIRKRISPTKYIIAFCNTFFLNHPFNNPAEYISRNLSYTGSCKYIAQRALRI